jgi:CRP-like cAMP-binding protein
MIEDLIKAATSGDPGTARDKARALSDPALLPEFRALLDRKLAAVERKLAYEFLDYLARNSRSAKVAALLLERLGAEK